MKTAFVVIGLMILGASGAGAADIQGKWGIGAGLFGGGGEVSLIRGRSERSAWLLEFRAEGSNADSRLESGTPGVPTREGNSNSSRFAGGPGLRRFTRPQAGVSPWHVATSPPHGRSPDLPILLADLRL